MPLSYNKFLVRLRIPAFFGEDSPIARVLRRAPERIGPDCWVIEVISNWTEKLDSVRDHQKELYEKDVQFGTRQIMVSDHYLTLMQSPFF